VGRQASGLVDNQNAIHGDLVIYLSGEFENLSSGCLC
jgi:hypothetical protein